MLCLGEAEGPEAWGTFDVYPSERICRVGVSVHLCALCYGPPVGLEHLGEAWTSMNYSPPYEMVLWQVGGGWSGLGFVTPASSVIANLKPVP